MTKSFSQLANDIYSYIKNEYCLDELISLEQIEKFLNTLNTDEIEQYDHTELADCIIFEINNS